jgi:hypothetical protein
MDARKIRPFYTRSIRKGSCRILKSNKFFRPDVDDKSESSRRRRIK